MIDIRRSHERGHADHGWLNTRHTFSFAHYFDPQFMGFGPIRVINEDKVEGGAGFGMHGHRDMEILSYVVSGQLKHEDSMGNGSTLGPGDVQKMTAGTGVRHSEVNRSGDEPLHFLQIWIEPQQEGLTPAYEERHIPEKEKQAGWVTVASGPERKPGAMQVHQEIDLLTRRAAAGERTTYEAGAGRRLWLQVIEGRVSLGEAELEAGDGAAIVDQTRLEIEALAESEFLLFDLP